MTDPIPAAGIRQDNHRGEPPPLPPQSEFPRLLHDFVMAMRFFSRLPMGDAPHEAPDLDRMAPVVPFASLTIALLPALTMMLLCLVGTPPFVAATVGAALLVVLTGAMAEDALADSMDGLFGGATAERRLDIMKDSRHGTYGVVAITLLLVLRVAVLGSVAAVNPLAAGGLMLASGIIARSGALWLSVDLPPAREGGAAASAGRVGRRSFIIGAVLATVLAVITAAAFVKLIGVALAVLGAAGLALLWSRACRRLVGGQTGDLIGGSQALMEATALLIFAIAA